MSDTLAREHLAPEGHNLDENLDTARAERPVIDGVAPAVVESSEERAEVHSAPDVEEVWQRLNAAVRGTSGAELRRSWASRSASESTSDRRSQAAEYGNERKVALLIEDHLRAGNSVEEFELGLELLEKWQQTATDHRGTEWSRSPSHHTPAIEFWSSMLSGAARISEHSPDDGSKVVAAIAASRNRYVGVCKQQPNAHSEALWMDEPEYNIGQIINQAEARDIRGGPAIVQVLAGLTDHGVVREAFWYKEVVKQATLGLPFEYYDELHARLDRVAADPSVLRRPADRVLSDAQRYIDRVLERVSVDESRDSKNSGALIKTLDRQRGGKKKELLMTSVIRLSNLVAKSVNEQGGAVVDIIDGREIKVDLPILAAQKVGENLGPALLRILYATRGKQLSGTASLEQARQDRVYADILAMVVAPLVDARAAA